MNKIIQLTDKDNNNIYPIGYAQGGMKTDLLWINSAPTTAFAAQTISLDLSGYSMVAIESSQNWTTNNHFTGTSYCSVGSKTMLFSMWSSAILCREATVATSGVTFTDAYGSNATSANNSGAIPYKIYGIKTSYLVPTEVHGLTYIEDESIPENITLMNNDGTKILYPIAQKQFNSADTSKLLASYNLYTSTVTYTATEKCYASIGLTYGSITLNGVTMYVQNSGATKEPVTDVLPLDVGDVLYINAWGNAGSGLRVYAAK